MLACPHCANRACVHYQGVLENERPYCQAFPNGIPEEIAYGDDLHLTQHEGDCGVLYTPQLTQNEFTGLNEGLIGNTWTDAARRASAAKRKIYRVAIHKSFTVTPPEESTNNLEHLVKQLLGVYGQYRAYLVNGEQVRNKSKALENFTDWAVHGTGPSQMPEVPEDEIWIEDTLDPKERHIALSMALRYLELLMQDVSVGKAYDEALRLAERERGLVLGKQGKNGQHLAGLYVQGPTMTPLGNPVWLVNGDIVRATKAFKKPDFVLGGNGMAYKFVPKFDIWIEEDVASSERIYILIHELCEWYQMFTKHWPYHKAHNLAEKIEYHWRHSATVPLVEDLNEEWLKQQIKE